MFEFWKDILADDLVLTKVQSIQLCRCEETQLSYACRNTEIWKKQKQPREIFQMILMGPQLMKSQRLNLGLQL